SPASTPQPAPPEVSPTGLTRLLRAGGLSPQITARIQSQPDWPELEKISPLRALTKIGIQLRREFQSIPRRPLGSRVAFIGSPGVGKTTALCKWLASDVFVRQRQSVVLKLDLDRANPGDALAVFCEALGVPCARSIPDLPTLAPDQSLYIDIPGVNPTRDADSTAFVEALDPLFTTSRVIVINAAYDPELIKRAYDFADHASCTHVVFTHLDELTHCGKLWEFILDRKLTPLFLSTGPNIAGDLEENIFETILARTFPEIGLETA
ncbi:MAG: hypothetical protein WCI46_13160, partial [Verrucomicrobiota bacterium]